MLFSGDNQNGTGSMDSDEKRMTVAESISRESDIIFLFKLVAVSFAGEFIFHRPSAIYCLANLF